MRQTRREFLIRAGYACGGYALGAAALASGVARFSLINTLAQGTDYKALVCVFLAGGNDGNNTVVPLGTTEYNQYSAVRGASGLAIPQANLLPITPTSFNTSFGLHPSLPDLQQLWLQQRLSVVCNVGPLVQPLTRQQYQSGGPRPYQLFSHSDQIAQWQTAIADSIARSGWGGRMADRFTPHASGYPTITALSGGIFIRGETTNPLSIASAPTPLNQVLLLNGFGTGSDEVERRNSMTYLRSIDHQFSLVRGSSETTQQAIDVGQTLSADPTLTTPFPNTALGNQLKQVAKVIKLNRESPALGLNRQIFFCQLGGFDTHQGQVSTQASLLTQLGQGMKAFYEATIEIGVASQVTTFTLSDFGRTLQPAGTNAGVVGSDHAWGSHHFVAGGAVRGGDFFGVAGPNGSVFPILQLSGPNDTDTRGRWIPTVAVEQYAATLASWFGVSAADIPVVFPNIGRFAARDLGFMS